MRVFFFAAALLLFINIFPPEVSWGQTTSDRITVLTDDHGYFPCMDCHSDQETNPTPRILEEEHFDPLEWDDETGQTREVVFGDFVTLGELLGETNQQKLHNQDLARIGTRLRIEQYMQDNDLTSEDSVWTLVHGGGNLWCLDCHNPDDRDTLIKLNGDALTFNESHLLCGQCHGPKLRDWDQGIHGKTTGYWDLPQDKSETSIRRLCVECHNPHSPAFPSTQPLAGPVLRLDPVGNSGHQKEASH
jgi:hypothetical protein